MPNFKVVILERLFRVINDSKIKYSTARLEKNHSKQSLFIVTIPSFLLPAPPLSIRITDARSSGYFTNNANMTIIAREPHYITCTSYGGRPPAVLEWCLPDELVVVLQNQTDVVRDNIYISHKVVNITPSGDDRGKSLRCKASHPGLQHKLNRSVQLNVQGK